MQHTLAHVLWIGGPPDCGKTTTATILAERHGLQTYHFDRNEMAHFGRLDRGRHPALYAAHPDRMTTEERWLGSPPEEMARDFPREHEACPIGSDTSLTFAIMTAPELRDPDLVKKLDAVAGRVLKA